MYNGQQITITQSFCNSKWTLADYLWTLRQILQIRQVLREREAWRNNAKISMLQNFIKRAWVTVPSNCLTSQTFLFRTLTPLPSPAFLQVGLPQLFNNSPKRKQIVLCFLYWNNLPLSYTNNLINFSFLSYFLFLFHKYFFIPSDFCFILHSH